MSAAESARLPTKHLYTSGAKTNMAATPVFLVLLRLLWSLLAAAVHAFRHIHRRYAIAHIFFVFRPTSNIERKVKRRFFLEPIIDVNNLAILGPLLCARSSIPDWGAARALPLALPPESRTTRAIRYHCLGRSARHMARSVGKLIKIQPVGRSYFLTEGECMLRPVMSLSNSRHVSVKGRRPR